MRHIPMNKKTATAKIAFLYYHGYQIHNHSLNSLEERFNKNTRFGGCLLWRLEITWLKVLTLVDTHHAFIFQTSSIAFKSQCSSNLKTEQISTALSV